MNRISSRILSVLLAVVIACASFPLTAFAGEPEDAPYDDPGYFCLVAEDNDRLIIEPTRVYYQPGETLGEALQASGHEFVGLAQGFVTGIDDVIYTPNRISYNGKYKFDEPCSRIHYVFRFSMAEEAPSEALRDLIMAMAEYNATPEAQDDDTVAAAYAAARAAYPGISDADAQAQFQALRSALDAFYARTRYGVQFQITQSGAAVSDYTVEIRNAKDHVVSPDASGQYHLLPGDYTVEVTSGFNAVFGKYTVTDGDLVVAAELPDGNAFTSPFWLQSSAAKSSEFSLASGGKMSTSFDPAVHEYTVVVSDTETSVYFADNYFCRNNEQTQNGEVVRSYYYYYTKPDGTEYANSSADVRGYNGKGGNLVRRFGGAFSGLLEKYGAGGTVRITCETKRDGYTQIQSYYVHIVRTRQLATLRATDTNGNLPLQPVSASMYIVSVGADQTAITVYPTAGPAEKGYSVLVNGEACAENGGVTVALPASGNCDIPIRVAHSDGTFGDYTLRVMRKAVTLRRFTATNPGATITVTNSAGAVIAPDANGSYALADGVSYTVTATLGTTSATRSGVTAKTGDFALSVPENGGWLGALSFGSVMQKTNKNFIDYPLQTSFDPNTHDYRVHFAQDKTTAYAWAALNTAAGLPSNATITARYVATNGKQKSVKITGGNKNGASLAQLFKANTPPQPVSIVVSYTQSGVTYAQTYTIALETTPSLKSLTVTADGKSAVLDPAFSSDKTDYTISASELTKEFTVTAQGYRKFYAISVNGTAVQTDGNGTATVTVPMEGIANGVLPVVVSYHGYTETTEYRIALKLVPAREITVVTTPADAIFCLTDVSGDRVFPQDNGKYKLLDGSTYHYTLTCNGYVSQNGSFTVTESDTITLTLQKAEPNPTIDPDLPAAWPNFRVGPDNNGVVNVKTPRTADEATLYWATQRGEGYGSSALASPIIVNDWIITSAGTTLYRVNRFTGEVDDTTGTLVGRSNFNIIPPTYANGMIFVGLSDGRVQAFNADTLESLWVYQDALRGQPNCPLVVHNGYLYTGFWNGEEKDARFVCLSITDEDPTQSNEAKQASWTYTVQGGFYWAGAYACDRYVLVGTDDGRSGYLSDTSSLLSFNPKTGRVIDRIDGLNGDIRSSVSYDSVTDRYYFTSKGGSFYSVAMNADGTFKKDPAGVQGFDLKEIVLSNYANDPTNPAMSTCTPVVHNGRAYVGVSGTSQFGAYSGHNITVIDLASWRIAYSVCTKGYPQTSGLLTTAYEDEDGYAYIYFIDNYTPGQLRVIKDKPGVTAPVDPVTETYIDGGRLVTLTDCAPVLFTPDGAQAQYAICSPICDEYGTLYFKNDSAYMMAVGSKITGLEIAQQPTQLVYREGDAFCADGLQVFARLANGLRRDVTDQVTLSPNAAQLSAADTDVTVYYNYVCYGDTFRAVGGNLAGQRVIPPQTYLNIAVMTGNQAADRDKVMALIDAIGEVTRSSGSAIAAARAAFDALDPDTQDLVTNYDTLTAAEARYAALMAQEPENPEQPEQPEQPETPGTPVPNPGATGGRVATEYGAITVLAAGVLVALLLIYRKSKKKE